MDPFWSQIVELCLDCVADYSGLAIGLATFVFVLWLARGSTTSAPSDGIDKTLRPRPAPDLPIVTVRNALTKKTIDFLAQFKVRNLFHIVLALVSILKSLYGVRGDKWDLVRSFKTAFIFYFLVVPLPAAFMPPVGFPQAQPDAQLLVATVFLILINALGDAVSVNLTVRVYQKALKYGLPTLRKPIADDPDAIVFKPFDARGEMIFYGMTVVDLVLASLSLVIVLMVSNILFGVQIGQFGFSLDAATLNMMGDRAQNFLDVRHQLYWFRNDEAGFLGFPGIPGMFFYGVTTYLPTFFVGLAALLWMLILPIRIIYSERANSITRLVAAETVVFSFCICVALLGSLEAANIYGFLITK